MSPEETRRKGELAQQITDNPIYSEAMDSRHAKLVAMWISEETAESREDLWRDMQAFKRFQSYLEKAITNGRRAVEEISERGNRSSGPRDKFPVS